VTAWADSILQPMMGVNYCGRALATNGPATTDFFRLFMIPGMAIVPVASAPTGTTR
jgi:hypothetical protein